MSDTIDCPKCEHEHEATESHEDDSGEMECEACEFKFFVEVDYDPSYSTSCVKHEYGPFEQTTGHGGEMIDYRVCVHCRQCQLRVEDGT